MYIICVSHEGILEKHTQKMKINNFKVQVNKTHGNS